MGFCGALGGVLDRHASLARRAHAVPAGGTFGGLPLLFRRRAYDLEPLDVLKGTRSDAEGAIAEGVGVLHVRHAVSRRHDQLGPRGVNVAPLMRVPGPTGGLRQRDRPEPPRGSGRITVGRSEEHTSELQSLMRISYAVFCLK